MAKKKVQTSPKPNLNNSKCSACGTPILYPYQMCNDCAQQGAKFSGMENVKKSN